MARVLVADDESAIRILFGTILTNAGYEVTVATDGNHAMKLLEAGEFDLLITDLVMPDREGLETIQAVRRSYPNVRVIAISGVFGGATLKVAGALGANRTMRKPVSGDELLATVQAVLAEQPSD